MNQQNKFKHEIDDEDMRIIKGMATAYGVVILFFAAWLVLLYFLTK